MQDGGQEVGHGCGDHIQQEVHYCKAPDLAVGGVDEDFGPCELVSCHIASIAVDSMRHDLAFSFVQEPEALM